MSSPSLRRLRESSRLLLRAALQLPWVLLWELAHVLSMVSGGVVPKPHRKVSVTQFPKRQSPAAPSSSYPDPSAGNSGPFANHASRGNRDLVEEGDGGDTYQLLNKRSCRRPLRRWRWSTPSLRHRFLRSDCLI